MARSSSSHIRTVALVVFALCGGGFVFAGCGGGGEERELIRRFFTASRVDDRGTLGNISMVSFNPRDEGTVSNFTVNSVSEEVSRTLRMVELSEELRDVQAAQQEHAVEMKQYQDENLEAISRVIEAERANESVSGADAEVQEMWTQFRDQSAKHSATVSAAEVALAEESRVASRSAFNPNAPFDVRGYEGVLYTKDVSITANVNRDGTEEERDMVITLEKVELGSGADMIEGRWVISAIN